MAQYIDKDALVAEIEKKIDELYGFLPDASKVENGSITTSEACNTGKYTALESFRRFLNTLEVKEVDWKKDSLTWKDINLIDHLLFDIKEDYDNGKLDKEKYYKEVLKKFKAQL